MPHKRCRVEVTRLVVTALRKWGACGWHQWSSGLRTISPLLVPSRSPRTSLLGDFLLKAAMSMTPTELAPNAQAQRRGAVCRVCWSELLAGVFLEGDGQRRRTSQGADLQDGKA